MAENYFQSVSVYNVIQISRAEPLGSISPEALGPVCAHARVLSSVLDIELVSGLCCVFVNHFTVLVCVRVFIKTTGNQNDCKWINWKVEFMYDALFCRILMARVVHSVAVRSKGRSPSSWIRLTREMKGPNYSCWTTSALPCWTWMMTMTERIL